MHGPARSTRHGQRVRDTCLDPPLADMRERDHRDAALDHLVVIGPAVRPVGDPDLYDATRVQTRVDQPAHRRAIAVFAGFGSLAKVVMRVERDKPCR